LSYKKKLRGALLDIPRVQCNGGKHGSGYGVVGGFLIPQHWLAPVQELICPIFPHINIAQLSSFVNTCLHGFAAKIGKKD
jgi:hypothetical protein